MGLDYEYRGFNELPKSENWAWTILDVILRTVNPLVGGSNPSRGANFQRVHSGQMGNGLYRTHR
jgi:hypothetical protein